MSIRNFRYRIVEEDDGGFGLYDDGLDGLKIGHYYEERRFVERIVRLYVRNPKMTAVAAYQIAAQSGR